MSDIVARLRATYAAMTGPLGEPLIMPLLCEAADALEAAEAMLTKTESELERTTGELLAAEARQQAAEIAAGTWQARAEKAEEAAAMLEIEVAFCKHQHSPDPDFSEHDRLTRALRVAEFVMDMGARLGTIASNGQASPTTAEWIGYFREGMTAYKTLITDEEMAEHALTLGGIRAMNERQNRTSGSL